MSGSTNVQAPTPDPNIGIAAAAQAELGKEYLAMSKEQFATQTERNVKVDALAEKVANSQLKAQEDASKWATEDRDRYKSVYQPMQDEFLKTANEWDSAERQDKLAGEAKADVMNASAAQSQARGRQMSAMGVNPTSGRYAGVERAADIGTSLAAAGAQNNSRNTVRNQAIALKSDAINMGNGLPSQASSSLGLGVGAGTSAMGTTTGAAANSRATYGIMQGGYQTGMQGYQNQASTLNSLYGNQLNAWSTQLAADNASSSSMMGGLGSLAGLGIMAFSSKKLKEDKKPAEGSLDAVNEMPVGEWKYKEGVADEGKHIGPYAEDFAKATGKGDGTQINLMDAVGVTMGAVQDLDKKVEQLAKSIGSRPTARAKRAPAKRARQSMPADEMVAA